MLVLEERDGCVLGVNGEELYRLQAETDFSIFGVLGLQLRSNYRLNVHTNWLLCYNLIIVVGICIAHSASPALRPQLLVGPTSMGK